MTDLAASVVICTYNRLRMLEDAVASCLQNATRAGAAYEVVITDNSPNGHARELANRMAAAGRPVRWVGACPKAARYSAPAARIVAAPAIDRGA